MKNKISKRILAGILTFGMAASLMPATAFAATDVDVDPGSGTLPVEYFSSTMYRWDEAAANRATAEADRTEGEYYQQTTVRYNEVAAQETSSYRETSYLHKVGEDYYPVYYTRVTDRYWDWGWQYETTYTLYYFNGNSYEQIGQTTNGNTTITLYRLQQGGYEGKGFYFTSSDNKPEDQYVPSFSKWSSTNQNYYIYSGLAASDLDDSSNAPFSDNVNAANLFAAESNEYTDVYSNVQVPFVYDEATGYYELNSDKWAVYFENGQASSGTEMAIADKPVSFYAGTPKNPMCGFQPFEDVSSQTQRAYMGTSADEDQQTTSYTLSDNKPTYGFGMVTSVDFQMTDDGKDAEGNPIEFSFSGDDDVWVYVDGVLALDIGGTHDAITGTIDFSTGDVTLTAEKYGKVGDKATDSSLSNPSEDSLSQTNLYTALGTTLTGFASQGSHKLTIYYMDRGQGATNCLIRFNLPQRDTVSVTKEISQAKDNEGNKSPLTDAEQAAIDNVYFGFTIYEGETALANKTYYIYENGELIRNASTNRWGHFSLQNNQEARFIVDISEEGKAYHVVEDDLLESGYKEPEYSYSSNIRGAEVTKEASGFTGMTVRASGSSTAADSISFVCENFLDKNLPNPGAALADDTYVIDYGLPVKLENVMGNDVWRGETAKVTKVEEIGEYISESGKYGETVLNDDGSITYTLTKTLDRVVTLQYTVQITGSGNTGDTETSETIEKTANIYIIPATSMYYEENFSDMVTYRSNLEWKDIKDGKEYGAYQEEGEVGTASDSTYGTDAVYLNNVGDSYGTSKYVSTANYATQFSYEFTGTGTAIYSRISTDSPYIKVEITKGGENVDRQYIDMRMIGNIATNTTLYNIPVYNNSGLGYGTYKVTVTVYKANTPVNGIVDETGKLITGTDKSGSEFYLDGIRVYQPVVNDDRAESAYASDGESNIALINIRSKIAADKEIGLGGDSFITLTDINDTIQNPEDYISIGPNEELYLNQGEGDTSYEASFYLLNWDTQRYNLYLGMKTPGNNTASVQVGGRTVSLNNSADCYYDVSDYVTVEMLDLDEDGTEETALGTLTISNASGLVSLTNIKVTGVDEFDIGYSNDLESSGVAAQTLYLLPYNYFTNESGSESEDPTEEVTEEPSEDPEEETPEETPENPEGEMPEETPENPEGETPEEMPENPEGEIPEDVPENPEGEPSEEVPEDPAEDPSAFVPERFDIHVNYAKLTKKATVNVATSTDVAYITIDGTRIEPGQTGSSYSFALSFTKVAKGTTYEVIAYNSDGVASEVKTAVAE